MCIFTRDSHFLLVASRSGPGLTQLCLYEASKGQVHAGEEGATGDAKEEKQEKLDRKNDKPKGKREKISRNHENDSRKQDKKSSDDKKGKEAKTSKDTEKPKTKKGKNTKGREKRTSEAGDELGRTLEEQYLDMLAKEADVYGKPRQFNLKEEQKDQQKTW